VAGVSTAAAAPIADVNCNAAPAAAARTTNWRRVMSFMVCDLAAYAGQRG
jgi:hypothetical protein